MMIVHPKFLELRDKDGNTLIPMPTRTSPNKTAEFIDKRPSMFLVARNPAAYGGRLMFPPEVEKAIRKMRLEYRDRRKAESKALLQTVSDGETS